LSILYSTPLCVVKIIIPVGIAHVGCVVLETVGTAGALGTAFIVTVAAAGVEQVLSAMLRTLKLYVPENSPAKVVLAWYVEPLSILYSTPLWVVKIMVPVGIAHVGCVVLATVGTAGALGTALMVTVAAAGVEQVLSAMLRTLKVYVFGLNPLNVVVG